MCSVVRRAAVYVNKAQAAANPEVLEQLISAKLKELEVHTLTIAYRSELSVGGRCMRTKLLL